MISLDIRTQDQISAELATRVRARRKERGLTQAQLAEKSGVSLGSIKRFETTHEVSLTSLVKIAIALGYADDFDSLFSERAYRSIDEVIADAERNRRR